MSNNALKAHTCSALEISDELNIGLALGAGRISRFRAANGYRREKLWPCRIEKCEWMYTEPYWEAQNGNPGLDGRGRRL